jgi:hypothetical protein
MKYNARPPNPLDEEDIENKALIFKTVNEINLLQKHKNSRLIHCHPSQTYGKVS